MRCLITVLMLLLATSSLVALLPPSRAARVGDYCIVRDSPSGYLLLSFPDLEILEEFDNSSFEGFDGFYLVDVMGTVGSEFLIALYDKDFMIIAQYDAATGSVTEMARSSSYLAYKFKWKNLHVLAATYPRQLVTYNEDTGELSFQTNGDRYATYTYPDENGYFWEIGSGIEFSDTKASGRHITENGITSTGTEYYLNKGELAEVENRDIEATGVHRLAYNGAIYDIRTGDRIATYPSIELWDLEEDFCLYGTEGDRVINLRTLDAKGIVRYRSQQHTCVSIAEEEDEYILFYVDDVINGVDTWSMVRIPREKPIQANRGYPSGEFPVNPWLNEDEEPGFFPINDTHFGCITANDGGTSLIVINAPERNIEASYWLDIPFPSSTHYMATSNSIWMDGFEFSLRDEDRYRLDWRFDAHGYTCLEEGIYFSSFGRKMRYDTVNRSQEPSDYTGVDARYFHQLGDGKYYYFHPDKARYYDDEEGFQNNRENALSLNTRDSRSLRFTPDRNSFATPRGEIFKNLDFQNPSVIIPFGSDDSDWTNNFALSDDKLYRLEDFFDYYGYPVTPHLRIWNLDGSQFREQLLPDNLISVTSERKKLKFHWQLVRVGEEIMLVASKGLFEMFLFDIDEQTGDILGLDNPDSCQLSYYGWYSSSIYGWIHHTSDKWKYAQDVGWTMVQETEDYHVEWSDHFGFIARPKYNAKYFYVYDMGWFGDGWKYYMGNHDEYRLYWNFDYKFVESDYPSLAPLTMDHRQFDIYSGGKLVESWRIGKSSAGITVRDNTGDMYFNVDLTYQGPTEPGDNTVRLVIEDYIYGLEGYYELTFRDPFFGDYNSAGSIPDPDNPGKRIQFTGSGAFAITRPPR